MGFTRGCFSRITARAPPDLPARPRWVSCGDAGRGGRSPTAHTAHGAGGSPCVPRVLLTARRHTEGFVTPCTRLKTFWASQVMGVEQMSLEVRVESAKHPCQAAAAPRRGYSGRPRHRSQHGNRSGAPHVPQLQRPVLPSHPLQV